MTRPSHWLVALSVVALASAMIVCAAGARFAPRRVELFHIAYVNACAMRSYQYHWQDPARLRQTFHYDFTMSLDSVVLAEVWVVDGPVLKFSQRVPLDC